MIDRGRPRLLWTRTHFKWTEAETRTGQFCGRTDPNLKLLMETTVTVVTTHLTSLPLCCYGGAFQQKINKENMNCWNPPSDNKGTSSSGRGHVWSLVQRTFVPLIYPPVVESRALSWTSDTYRDKGSGLSWVLMCCWSDDVLAAGLCAIVACSWFAHNVIRAFYNPYTPVNTKWVKHPFLKNFFGFLFKGDKSYKIHVFSF